MPQDKLVCAIGPADKTNIDTDCVEVGAALGKLIDALEGDTDCVEVGAALGKLVDALDGDRVSVEVGAALGKLVCALDGDTDCEEVGAALGKLVNLNYLSKKITSFYYEADPNYFLYESYQDDRLLARLQSSTNNPQTSILPSYTGPGYDKEKPVRSSS